MLIGQSLDHRLHDCGTSRAQADALIAIECLPQHSIKAAVPMDRNKNQELAKANARRLHTNPED